VKSKIRHYEGELVDVNYDLPRCIHAEECIKRLATVFDSQARPWIQPAKATAEEIVKTVIECPSGALHFVRKDNGASESIPEINTVKLVENGPLYVHGHIILRNEIDEAILLEDTRAALCRCGSSDNKPLCDNTHKHVEFSAPYREDLEPVETKIQTGGALSITATHKGPLQIQGHFTLIDSLNQVIFEGEEAWLCRCGGSANKPFCDGTHSKIDFQAD
jgi:CDGSH-type Zn-finger protein/uncharacterized Fe-S cluster protein YjdI